GLLGIATSEPRLHLGMKLASFMHDGEIETVKTGSGGEGGDDGDEEGLEEDFKDSPTDERQSA
ncbi:MAG: hypothetical protein ACREEN_08025, partial [Stellaceae bacterium]